MINSMEGYQFNNIPSPSPPFYFLHMFLYGFKIIHHYFYQSQIWFYYITWTSKCTCANNIFSTICVCVWPETLHKSKKQLTRGVWHHGLAIYIKKHLSMATEELWKLKYFTWKNIIFKKSPKETKILQDITTL